MLNRWLDDADRRLCAIGLRKAASWNDVLSAEEPRLYAGNINRALPQFWTHYGITPFLSSSRNIRHDIRERLPIPDNSIAVFQAEDVFEHIAYEELYSVVQEVFRILKPGGLFRLSVPDYRSPILSDRSIKDSSGQILFDPGGGGRFENGLVLDGGHLWFPVYETVKALFDASSFREVRYQHYTTQTGQSILNPIDYTLGNIQRTPDHDERVASPRASMSVVVDARK